MNKLFTIRECLDIEDASRHLTGSFNEEVTPKDVLNLVMEGKIPISVRFKFPVTVRPAKINDGVPVGRWGVDFLYFGSEEKKYLTLHGDQQTLEGVVDLASVGSYMRNLVSSQVWNGVLASDVSAEDLLLRNGNGDLLALVGVLTKGLRNDTGEEWGEFSYSFPEDSQLVIRTSAIRLFEESLNTPVQEKDVGTKERHSLLCIIGVLCNEARIPYKNHSKAAEMIQGTAAMMGLSIGETTIENHLKKIADAMATRMK